MMNGDVLLISAILVIEEKFTRKVVSTVGAKATSAAQIVGGDVRVQPSNRNKNTKILKYKYKKYNNKITKKNTKTQKYILCQAKDGVRGFSKC